MSSFFFIAPRDGGTVEGLRLEASAAVLSAGVLEPTKAVRAAGIVAMEASLRVGDPRLEATFAERRTVFAVGHVRVDAREELVQMLGAKGADVSATDTDIALFAATWEVFGAESPRRILGDFAVVVWEPSTHRCTLIRDRFGVHLLYYAVTGEHIVASNSLEAVLAAPGVDRALNAAAIADYVAVGFNEDLSTTSYRAVQRVPPAHHLEISAGRSAAPYWSLTEIEPERVRTRDYATAFQTALTQSVSDRLRSPSASMLMSGGLDSPALAALASSVMPAPKQLLAITVDLPVIAPSHDRARATVVAATLGITHRLFNGDALGFYEGVAGERHALWRTPEPYDEHDLVIWRTLLQECAAWSPVLFYGEDPDALLSPPGIVDLLRSQSPWSVVLDVMTYAARERKRPHLGIRDALRHRNAQPTPGDTGYLLPHLRLERESRVTARTRIDHPRSEAIERLSSPLWQPLLESLDPRVIGIPVSGRLPYLDLRVVTLALSAPPIPWAQRKKLLREAIKGLIPNEVRLAPKQGLPTHTTSRVVQWRRREPEPFSPSERLLEFVDRSSVEALVTRNDGKSALIELRLRVLDRWLAGALGAPRHVCLITGSRHSVRYAGPAT